MLAMYRNSPLRLLPQQNPVEFGMPTVSVKLDEIDFQKINFINPEDVSLVFTQY